MMSQAVIVLVVICLLCPTASPACGSLENTCERVNFSPPVTFKDIRRQICSSPTNTVFVTPPKFLIEPSNQIAGSRDTATFKCRITPSPNYQPKFHWEHNGNELTDGDDFEITNDTTSSTLQVLKVAESTEGNYRCIVTSAQEEYTISSRYGHLQAQRCSGWKDTILPPSLSNETSVHVAIPKGGSTILECSPNTTLSPGYYHAWLKDNTFAIFDENLIKLPNGGLLIRHFDPPPGGIVNYRCIITTTDCPVGLEREFSLRASEDNEPSIITPTNQTSLLGASISLYCITNNKGSNTWLKDGQPLDPSFNTTLFGHDNEVLVLNNVTMEMDGVYSCVTDGDGSTRTAHLTVLAPPTSAHIQATGHTSTNDAIYLSPSDPHNLTLTCLTESQSGNTDMIFQWFFRGEPITATPLVGVIFAGGGPILNVAGTDVYGSYQCVASNEAGSMTALLSVYQDKPSPPSSLTLTLDRDLATTSRPKKTYLYKLLVTPPETNFDRFAGYYVEAYTFRTGDRYYKKCTCNMTENVGADRVGTIDFLANNYLECELYFRVAAISSTRGKSDFLPYYNDRSNCGTYIAPAAPPSPTDLVWSRKRAGNDWNVTVSWRGPTDEQYPNKLIATSLNVECTGTTSRIYNHLSSTGSQQLGPLPPCTVCNWTVTFSTLDSDLSSSSTMLDDTTPAFYPPPTLNNVSRSDSDGQTFSVSFSIPHTDTLCVANQYTVQSSGKVWTSDLSTCTKDHSEHTTDGYMYRCTVPSKECWQALNVTVTVGDSSGGRSDPSTSVHLNGLTEDDLIGFSKLLVQSTTATAITVSPQITDGIYCLLDNPTASTRAQLCISANSINVPSCQSISSSQRSYTFRGLTPDTNYTMTAVLSVEGVGNRTLSVTQPTEPETPTTAQVTSSSEGTAGEIVLEVTIPLAVTVLTLVLVALLVCCCCVIRKHRRKHRDHEYRRTALHESNEQLNDDDLVSIIGPDGAPSVHSEHTDLHCLLSENKQRVIDYYMKSIPVDPAEGDGSQVETIAEVHDDLMEDCQELASGWENKKSKSHHQKSGRRKGRKGGEDVEPLIEVELEDKDAIVSVTDSLCGIRDETWKENLQKSPLEAARELSPIKRTHDGLQVETIAEVHDNLMEDCQELASGQKTKKSKSVTDSPCGIRDEIWKDHLQKSPLEAARVLSPTDPHPPAVEGQDILLQPFHGDQSTESAEELITEALSSTSGFICREEVDTSLSTSGRGTGSIPMLTQESNQSNSLSVDTGYVIEPNRTVMNSRPQSADSGYIMDHSTVTVAIPQSLSSDTGCVMDNNTACPPKNEPSLSFNNEATSATEISSGYVPNSSTQLEPQYVQEESITGQTSSSQGYVPLPEQSLVDLSSTFTTEDARSSSRTQYVYFDGQSSSQGYSSLPDRSLPTQNSTENLSQDSSVFDDTFTTSLANTSQQPRRTASSGVFSTSSDAPSEASGFSLPDSHTPDPYDSDRHTRSPSEGYVSARATPAFLDTHFDIPEPSAASLEDPTRDQVYSRDDVVAKPTSNKWNTPMNSSQLYQKAELSSKMPHTRTASTPLILPAPSQTSYSTIPTLLPHTKSMTDRQPGENGYPNTNEARSLEDYINTEDLDLSAIQLELADLMKASDMVH